MRKYTEYFVYYHGLILLFPRGCKTFLFVNIVWFVCGSSSALFGSKVGCESPKKKGEGAGSFQGSLESREAAPGSSAACPPPTPRKDVLGHVGTPTRGALL